MKEYRISIRTRIVLHIDTANIPETRDLIMGLKSLFAERDWAEESDDCPHGTFGGRKHCMKCTPELMGTHKTNYSGKPE